MANYLDENGLKTLADNINSKFIPYTGAKKDINIGSHVFTVGSESSVYTQTTPGSIALKNPIGTLSIGTYSLRVNGTTIYWPTVSADPNGKYLALRSDIPSIDDHLSATSTNAVQNKVVNSTISELSYQLAMVKENIFQTVLSEIDYTEDFATLYPIPDTLSDTDGTHRVLFSETQLREVAGNSVSFNQFAKPFNISGVWFCSSALGTLSNETERSIFYTRNNVEQASNVAILIQSMSAGYTTTKGHKYFLKTFVTPSDNFKLNSYVGSYTIGKIMTANVKNNYEVIITANSNSYLQFISENGGHLPLGGTVLFEDTQLFDLTLMGLDSVSMVEEAKSELLKRGIDIDQYNPFSDGEIRNTTASGVKVNGYNLLNLNRTEGTLIGFSNTNKRNFDLNKYYVGLTRDGYYNKSNVTSFEISGNQVKLKSNQNGYGIAFPMKVEPGKSYTLSATVASDTAGYNTGLGIGYYNSEGLNIGFTEIENQSAEKSKAFTTPSGCSLIVVVLYASTHINLTTFSNICFHLSTLRTGYAPYKEPKAISFASTELLSAGDAHDTIEVVEGDKVAGIQRYNLVKVKRVGTVDLGTLGWNVADISTNRSFVHFPGAKLFDNDKVANIVSARFKADTYNNVGSNASGLETISLGKIGENPYLYVKTSLITASTDTTEKIKTAMSGIALNYELATPTRTIIAENLTFEEVSATIEQGGSVETVYETLAPNCTTGFVVKKAKE